jgi:hypothetical protein
MYEWQENQLEKIWEAIDTELQKCKSEYGNNKNEIFKL